MRGGKSKHDYVFSFDSERHLFGSWTQQLSESLRNGIVCLHFSGYKCTQVELNASDQNIALLPLKVPSYVDRSS